MQHNVRHLNGSCLTLESHNGVPPRRGWLSVLVLVVAGEVGLVGVRVRVGVAAVAVLVSVLDVVVGVRAVRV